MIPEFLQGISERINPSHTALLIIDMQRDLVYDNYLCHKANRDLSATRNIIPNIKILVSRARTVGVAVCHVGFWTLPDNGSDSVAWLQQRRCSTYSSEDLCLAGTPGAEFIDELKPEKNEVVIHKHRYSAFKGTNLDMILRARCIKTVITAGVSTNVCVESTLRDAFETGYHVVIPSDATASWNMSLHESTLETVKHRFGYVTCTSEILNHWKD